MIPACCMTCRHYMSPVPGDYGGARESPYCQLNVFFPTRTGWCRRHQGRALSIRASREGSADVPQPWLWHGLRGRYWYVHFLNTEYWRALERQRSTHVCKDSVERGQKT